MIRGHNPAWSSIEEVVMWKRLALAIAVGSGLAASAHAMRPGLWEVTSQISGGGMPAMPAVSAAERQQMEAMGIKLPSASGGAMSFVARHCVSKEQAASRQPPQSDEDLRQGCKQKDLKISGNTTTWKVECSGDQKMTGTGSVTYQGEESYQGETTFELQEPGQRPTTTRQRFAGRWLAAVCK
jgi:hypothetical protein